MMRLSRFRAWWKRRGIDPDAALLAELHAPDRFRAILAVERLRVDRAGGALALVAFRFPPAADREFLLFAQSLQARVRATDHAGLLDELCVGVVLWNTDREGAERFVDSVVSEPSQTSPAVEIFVYPNSHRADRPPASRDGDWLESSIIEELLELEQTVHSGNGHADRPTADWKPPSLENAFTTVKSASESGPAASDAGTLATLKSSRLQKTAAGPQQPRLRSNAVVRSLSELFAEPLPVWKRALDVVGAGAGLLVLSPLLAATAITIKATSSGPVLFAQRRTGLGGRPFTIYKFRTMCVDAEARKAKLRQFSEQDGPAFKMANDPRVTPIGRYLRKTCIDELPQLWNVLVGDMTLVGPRPLPCDEQSGCDAWQSRRLDVTPGLTCIWQVHGKSKVSFTDWMRMDIRYIRARTFVQDVRLVFETLWAMLLHRGSC